MSYPSDLTDGQWELIRPFVEYPNGYGKRRKHPIRDVINSILYLNKTGCQLYIIVSITIKRRSAIEATIGHIKHGTRLDRNYLIGKLGDHMNAVLSACGCNLHLILAAMAKGHHPVLFSVFLLSRLLAWVNFHHRSEHKTGIPFPFALGIH